MLAKEKQANTLTCTYPQVRTLFNTLSESEPEKGVLRAHIPLRPRNWEEDVTSLCAQALLSSHFPSEAGAVTDTKYFALEKQERCPEDEIPSHRRAQGGNHKHT